MRRTRLYAILHDRTWLILFGVLLVLLLLLQDGYLSRGMRTHNDHLRDLYEVQRWQQNPTQGQNPEGAMLSAYRDRYGVSAGSVQEFVDSYLDTAMQGMKIRVVEELSAPYFLFLFCIVPCFMAGRGLFDAAERRWRQVLILLLETLLVMLVLNTGSKLLLIQKWAFHARVAQFEPVPAANWVQLLLLRPLAYYSAVLLPLSFFVCAFRTRTPAAIATVLVTAVMYLSWQADLLYLILNRAADHVTFCLSGLLAPEDSAMPRVAAISAVLLVFWLAADLIAYRRRMKAPVKQNIQR